jgi:arylsulfatase A-like enzyme
MTDRSQTWTAFGEGALFGEALGLVLGVGRVEATRELAQGTPLLAAWTLLVPVLASATACAALSLAATPLLRSIGATGSRAARRAAAAGIAAAAFVWVWAAVGPARRAIVPVPYDDRPKFVLAALGAAAILGIAFAGTRALDLLRDRRFRRPRAAAAVLGLLALVSALAGTAVLSSVENRRAAGKPNVLIVCLDTMRADALGALGGHGRTPLLDRLAAEGVLFEQATAAAPWTLPSHVSLFTSRLPFDHGTRFSMNRINPNRLLLAERFREAGYRTGGFAGDAYVDSKFGFDQGFDRYEDFHEVPETGPEPIAEAALRWVRSDRGRPFFAFVHTYEPHSPYTEGDFADPADAEGLPPLFDSPLIQRIHDGELVLSENQRRFVRDLYAGDVARTDRILGGMIEALRVDGILDRTILVVLSDHGEDLWDHDVRRSPGHGHSLYQELMHVPLFVRSPGTALEGARIRTPVSLLDVAPTLLELCGLPTDDSIHGRSLVGAIRAGVEPSVAPVWSESVEYGPDRFAVREGRWKAILTPPGGLVHGNYRPEVGPLEVFDLESDPREKWDRSAEPNDVTVRLVRMLTERVAAKVKDDGEKGPAVEPDDELMETLRSLGYVR